MGNSIVLYCFVQSKVPFTVMWSKESIPLDQPSRYEKSVNSSLWLPARSIEESGNYTCSASNIAGTSTATTQVSVKGMWQIFLYIAIR